MERPTTDIQKFQFQLSVMPEGEYENLKRAARSVPMELLMRYAPVFKRLTITPEEASQCLQESEAMRVGAKWQRRRNFNRSVLAATRRKIRFQLSSPYSNPKNRRVDDDIDELEYVSRELKEEKRLRHEFESTIGWLFIDIEEKDKLIASQKEEIEEKDLTIYIQKNKLDDISNDAADLLQRATLGLRKIFDLAE